jgi:8-oxo-dGTP diphosphatase
VARVSSSRRRVVAATLVREDHVLLCHRRDDRSWCPAVWDLPGGHVEPTETHHEALVRECREELGVDVRNLVDHVTVRTGDAVLRVFVVRSWEGEPTNTAPEEHQAIGWFAAADLAGLPLADPRLGPLLQDTLRRGVTDATPLRSEPPSGPPQQRTDGRTR